MNTTKPSSSTPETAQATFNQQIASLDPQRAQSLAGLSRIRTVKAAMLKRDQLRATQKYGANDPRIAALQAQQTLNNQFSAEVAYRASLAATPVPAANPQGYTFYGNVLDASHKPKPGLTLGLYDQTGVWIRDFGYACTDANGAFSMSYQAPVQSATQSKGKSAAPRTRIARALASNHTQSSFSAEIRVIGPDKQLLYRSATPLHPRLGASDYRLIILDPAGACTPPPA